METTEKKCSFDEMPSLLARLLERFDNLSALLHSRRAGVLDSNWMDIDQLRAYLPGHMARSTIYEWIKDKSFRSRTESKSCGKSKKIS